MNCTSINYAIEYAKIQKTFNSISNVIYVGGRTWKHYKRMPQYFVVWTYKQANTCVISDNSGGLERFQVAQPPRISTKHWLEHLTCIHKSCEGDHPCSKPAKHVQNITQSAFINWKINKILLPMELKLSNAELLTDQTEVKISLSYRTYLALEI